MSDEKLNAMATIVSAVIATKNTDFDDDGKVILTGNDNTNTMDLSLLIKYVQDCLE